MPLAIEHDVVYLKTYKTAYSKINGQRHEHMFSDDIPQRAIASCLIMVLEGKLC